MNTNQRSPSNIPFTPAATWRRRFSGHRFLTCLAACFLALLLPAAAQVPPTPIYVLTESGSLATTTLDAPGTLSTPVTITGVVAGETLVAMDVRPQNQGLYVLGVNETSEFMTLYYLSPQSGTAVAVGPAFSLTSLDGVTPVDLPATGWDMDFNPSADRLRVVVQGLNFRINPNTGAPVDGNGGVNGTNPDGAINGATTTVSATAYANSQPNTTITTQYTLDSTTNSLFIQNPPNNGTQTLGQTVTVGGATLNFSSVSGFDIPPGVNAVSNSAVAAGFGYAVLRTPATSKLYQINLANGQATEVADLSVRNFTIRPRLGVSIGLDSTGTDLIRFSPLNPGTGTSVGVWLLTSGETLVGIDMRPATGQFYGLGINPTTDTGTLYLIDPQVGNLTVIGSSGQIAFSGLDFPTINPGYDIDFNPTVDRLRVVTGNGFNFRINPITGAPVDSDPQSAVINPDVAINGATSTVQGTAYTNNFGGATATTQYTLDATTDSLYIQNPPNNGTQNLSVSITSGGGSPLDFSSPVGFDILGSVTVATSASPATGDGYFTAINGVGRLYRLNLTSGVATDLGATSVNLYGFAILSVPSAPVVSSPTATALMPTEATLSATIADDGGDLITGRGIVFAPTATSANPGIGDAGVTQLISLGTTGTFSLTAQFLTTGTSYSFRAYATNAAGTTYSSVVTFTPPILAEPSLPDAMVSEVYTADLNLAAGTTVTAKGLPAGLKLNSTTGVITGRLSLPGVYQITFTAKGPGGVMLTYISTLAVQTLPRTAVGTFLGYIMPDPVLNGNTGGRIEVTTTTNGSFSLKFIQRTKTTSAKGFLSTAVGFLPELFVTLADGTQVSIVMLEDNTLVGFLSLGVDQTSISGWRKTYDKIFYPADQEMGYYTVGLEVAAANVGNPLVPQGTGFASITLGVDGSTKLVGKSADGGALTSTGFLGPNGEILVYAPLYGKLGSIFGMLVQTPDANGNYAENTVTGSLFFTKPTSPGRTYPAAITLAELDVQGKYLARAATGGIVLGLPSSSSPSTLDFSDGGISLATINPDLVDTVTYPLPGLKAVVPLPGSAQNLGRTTLTISPSNGNLSGGFSLLDGTLKRSVKFQGMIIRSNDGSTTAKGYFLLPQIPVANETAATSPILSGRVGLLP